MGGVLCSVTVCDRLKIKKSLAINYWYDTISGVEINTNVIKSINFEDFQLGLWFCTIFHFNTIFFNSLKKKLVKICGGGGWSPTSTPGIYGPALKYRLSCASLNIVASKGNFLNLKVLLIITCFCPLVIFFSI